MKTVEEVPRSPEASLKARRAKRIILWVMAILMLLPFVLVWLTGSVGF